MGDAKRRHAAHAALVELKWQNLRASVRRLSLLEVNAIAGEFYEGLIPQFQAGRFSPVFNVISPATIDQSVKDPTPTNRAEFRGFHGAEIDAHVAGKGLVFDNDTRESLDYAIAKAILQANQQSAKYLDGDFSSDPMAGRFPVDRSHVSVGRSSIGHVGKDRVGWMGAASARLDDMRPTLTGFNFRYVRSASATARARRR